MRIDTKPVAVTGIVDNQIFTGEIKKNTMVSGILTRVVQQVVICRVKEFYPDIITGTVVVHYLIVLRGIQRDARIIVWVDMIVQDSVIFRVKYTDPNSIVQDIAVNDCIIVSTSTPGGILMSKCDPIFVIMDAVFWDCIVPRVPAYQYPVGSTMYSIVPYFVIMGIVPYFQIVDTIVMEIIWGDVIEAGVTEYPDAKTVPVSRLVMDLVMM